MSRGVAQLVEHRPPNPSVAGSNPATPAKISSSKFSLLKTCRMRQPSLLSRLGPGGGTADTLA
jgi:hypothetical protein